MLFAVLTLHRPNVHLCVAANPTTVECTMELCNLHRLSRHCTEHVCNDSLSVIVRLRGGMHQSRRVNSLRANVAHVNVSKPSYYIQPQVVGYSKSEMHPACGVASLDVKGITGLYSHLHCAYAFVSCSSVAMARVCVCGYC
jgi:hypothetical protein